MARPIKPRRPSEHQATLIRIFREIEVGDHKNKIEILNLLNDVLKLLASKE